MSEPEKCPECGAEVPEPAMSFATGIGDPPSFQPDKQFTQCENSHPLERMKEPGPGHEWRRQT